VTAAAGVFTAITGLFLTDWGSAAGEAPSSDDSTSEEEMAKDANSKSGIASLRPWISIGGGATVGAIGTF
jgi:hypothetical protein